MHVTRQTCTSLSAQLAEVNSSVTESMGVSSSVYVLTFTRELYVKLNNMYTSWREEKERERERERTGKMIFQIYLIK